MISIPENLSKFTKMLTTLTYGNPFGNEADKFSPLKRDTKN